MDPARGVFSAGVALAGTYAATSHIEACPDINGPACERMPTDPQQHDLALYFADVRLHMSLGLGRRLAADLVWSLRIVSVRFQLEDVAGRPITSPYGEDIHHRTETLIGPTDPWLTLRAAQELGRWRLRARAGVTLPVGSTVENPFRLGREGKVHQHVQFGTGTFDPIVEMEVRRDFDKFDIAGSMLARIPLYRNEQGYRAGVQLLAGVRATSALGTERWRFAAGALAYHEQPERWDGVVETEGNLGRTDLLVELGVSHRWGDGWVVDAALRVPVLSRAVGAQLTTPAVAQLGLMRSF